MGISERLFPWCVPHLRRYQRLLRYLVSGSIAAVVDLGLLYIFTDLFLIHYLVSAIFAFLITFFVSFTLQKFWTFQDSNTDRVHIQVTIYFLVALGNLIINTALMYLFVDIILMWYMAAQFLASGLLACESFFISRHFVFNTRTTRERS